MSHFAATDAAFAATDAAFAATGAAFATDLMRVIFAFRLFVMASAEAEMASQGAKTTENAVFALQLL